MSPRQTGAFWTLFPTLTVPPALAFLCGKLFPHGNPLVGRASRSRRVTAPEVEALGVQARVELGDAMPVGSNPVFGMLEKCRTDSGSGSVGSNVDAFDSVSRDLYPSGCAVPQLSYPHLVLVQRPLYSFSSGRVGPLEGAFAAVRGHRQLQDRVAPDRGKGAHVGVACGADRRCGSHVVRTQTGTLSPCHPSCLREATASPLPGPSTRAISSPRSDQIELLPAVSKAVAGPPLLASTVTISCCFA